MSRIDAMDRRLITATQSGLPLTRRPYDDVGAALDISGEEVRRRLQAMMARGVIRRIGAVPNHYKLGLTHNGMTVWDVDDARISALGPEVGALEFVSHCYQRPRHLPDWPYNFFAMVHGRSAGEVMEKIERVARVLGDAARAHDVLYSKRILKKTGLRLQN
ncbi:MAG: protein nirH [Hyphomicrobiales bacterium]|nr:MAG: protein nirH [Hyphomicrobiales bacterium]